MGDDGSTQQYSSPWSLELVDFEVEDENGDGVFEPGEHLFIRRIKVRNVGGMPSPTCRIPVTLASESEWFASVHTDEGGLPFLPTSVPAGESASMEGAIKVRIKDRSHANSIATSMGAQFSAKDRLSIRADMPWLDRQMPAFEFTKEIAITYPCSLGNIQCLSTIAQGAVSKVQYEVKNISNRPLGEPGALSPGRIVEVRSTLPADFGRLITEAEKEVVEVINRLPSCRSKGSLLMQQQFRVLSTARSHVHFRIMFELYLESPLQDPNKQDAEMILVERHTISLQVSNAYNPLPNSSVLLITNPKTTERQSHAIQHFVRNDLCMEMDQCNIHQNGGLLRASDDGFEDPLPITTAYRDKSILILDNAFDFFGAGERTTSQQFDPQWLFDTARSGTSSLFLGGDDDGAFEEVVRSAVVLPLAILEHTVKRIRKSHIFHCPQDFVDAIRQEKHRQDKARDTALPELSAIPLRQPKWYRFGRDGSEKQAKALARYLRNHLPNERFLVSFVSPRHVVADGHSTGPSDQAKTQGSRGQGHLIILPGLDHHSSITATESGLTCLFGNEDNPTQSRLDELSKYNIIAALPFAQRTSMLWCPASSDTFVIKAISLSMARDVSRQLNSFLDSAYKPLVNVDTTDAKSVDAFFNVHLPHFGHIFNNPQANTPNPAPGPIVEVLQWTLSLSATLKRHRRLDAMIRAMIHHRPSTHILDTHLWLPDPVSYHPDALIPRIAELTKTPEYRFTKGEISASTVVPRTRYCAPGEWDSMVKSVDEWRQRLESDRICAQKELGRMLLDVTPPDAVELGAGA
ncbi:hypothetical protein K458DRAFT_91399 [Lentithecium fluviatile CBS 122367]|uniref:DUF7932 domain-containing protein n=1 Tax=Lentithecium fluviatile CBS 122367 TaxID=1168545 RepID=A0A6G1IRE2_9PLEO|nr:hypothetical protein K458DRAFT_91399 [Lentithecium fluviatile CBS 122367]